MSRKTTTVIKLFREGRTLQEINVQLPKTNGIKSILASLDKGVLRGDIKSSDILFTVDKSTRAVVTEIMNNDESIDWDDATVEILQESCQKAGHDIDKHDLDVILRYHPKHFQYGDLYEDMRTIETTLHRYVEQTLKDKFGEEWLECIPKKQKEDMEQWHSDDPNSRCVFEKATLRNLFEIIKCKACDFKDEFGNYLKNHFGYTGKHVHEKRDEWFENLVKVRNRIMHPVGPDPTTEQFDYTVEFRRFVEEQIRLNDHQ